MNMYYTIMRIVMVSVPTNEVFLCGKHAPICTYSKKNPHKYFIRCFDQLYFFGIKRVESNFAQQTKNWKIVPTHSQQ